MITNELLKSYVDPKNGLISPHIFSSQEIYELERVFGRTWLFLAHESQIPKPGGLCLDLHGRRPGARGASERSVGQGIPEFLPPSRYAGVSRRRRQCESLHLHLSRMVV